MAARRVNDSECEAHLVSAQSAVITPFFFAVNLPGIRNSFYIGFFVLLIAVRFAIRENRRANSTVCYPPSYLNKPGDFPSAQGQ